MTANRLRNPFGRALLLLALISVLFRPGLGWAAAEQSMPLLQIGTKTYTNVTVTTKAKSYIFILHSGGMTNIRVADLPREALQRLGYLPPDPVRGSNEVAGSGSDSLGTTPNEKSGDALKERIANLPIFKSPQAKQLLELWRKSTEGQAAKLSSISPTTLYPILGGILLVYLFMCHCFSLICRNAGRPGGVLVWLPIFQVFPLLHAAGMTRWWFLASFIPVLNIVAVIIWCLEIARACGKNALIGIMLMLPGLQILAILILAFSGNEAAAEESRPRREIMTLETA